MTIAIERLSARAAALLLTIFVTGLFQDLLRKSIPGQPVWLLVSFLVPAVGGLFLIRPQGLDLPSQTTLIGQRHFFRNSNPKRKRGNELGTIDRKSVV